VQHCLPPTAALGPHCQPHVAPPLSCTDGGDPPPQPSCPAMLSFPRSSRATPFAAQPGPHDTDSLVDRDHTPPGCAAQPTSQQRHSATPAPHQGRPCPSTSPTSDPHPAGRITATLATGITPPGQQRRHPFTLTQRPSVSTVVCAHDGPTNTTATARRPRQRPQQPRDQPLDTVNPPFRPPPP